MRASTLFCVSASMRAKRSGLNSCPSSAVDPGSPPSVSVPIPSSSAPLSSAAESSAVSSVSTTSVSTPSVAPSSAFLLLPNQNPDFKLALSASQISACLLLGCLCAFSPLCCLHFHRAGSTNFQPVSVFSHIVHPLSPFLMPSPAPVYTFRKTFSAVQCGNIKSPRFRKAS